MFKKNSFSLAHLKKIGLYIYVRKKNQKVLIDPIGKIEIIIKMKIKITTVKLYNVVKSKILLPRYF